jgi:hypothetical protein
MCPSVFANSCGRGEDGDENVGLRVLMTVDVDRQPTLAIPDCSKTAAMTISEHSSQGYY